MKDKIVWAPLFRVNVLFYFTTSIWALSYFSANSEEEVEEPMIRGAGNKRMLFGLSDRYVKVFLWSLILAGLLKLAFVICIPLLHKYKITKLYREGVMKPKGSEMVLDRPYRWTAPEVSDFFFLRRFLLAFTTVVFNHSLVTNLYVYFYGSIFYLGFMI